MAWFESGGGTVKPMTLTQRNSYSYSGGNYAISEIIIKNQGWKTISASRSGNIQYASVYNDDTGERLSLNLTTEINISAVKNIRLLLQSTNSANGTATATWNLV